MNIRILGQKTFAVLREISCNTSGSLLFLSLLVLFFFKTKLMAPAASESIVLPAFHHDSVIFAAIIFVFTCQMLLTRLSRTNRLAKVAIYCVGMILRAGIAAVILFYTADVFAYKYFSTRLYADDIKNFYHESNAISSLLSTLIQVMHNRGIIRAALVTMVYVGYVFLLLHFIFRQSRRVNANLPAIFVVIFFVLTIFFIELVPEYGYTVGDKVLYENVIERNWDYFKPNRYSSHFRQAVLLTYKRSTVHEQGMGLKPNILLVIVESLSSCQSMFFSGLNDFTPNLDRMAENNIAIPGFFANGWTTQGGLISILTGAVPVVGENTAYNRWGSARLQYFNSSDTLPWYLQKQGYSAIYLGSGDVNFLNQGTWLKQIGFSVVEGGDAPVYPKQGHRGPFDSVDDRVFFERVVSYLHDLPANKPYFVCAQTYWSHHPYLSPEENQNSDEEEVFKYTDRQLGMLYSELVKMGFFENGLLIITGDHHSMDPLTKDEVVKYGASAGARVPMVIAWQHAVSSQIIQGSFQQVDVMTSIKAITSTEFDRYEDRGNFLGPVITAPPYIIQARGDSRDLVYVRQGTNDGFLRVRGDKTGFISGDITNRAEIVQTVNYDRVIQGLTNQVNIINN